MIKISKIIFSRSFFNSLHEFLFSNAPKENGCFLLGNPFTFNNDHGIIITDIIKPKNNSWDTKGEHSLQPTSTYINECVLKAEQENSSLIFTHTHPNSIHPPGFSVIDESSNKKLFQNLSEILGDLPLASLVFSKKGVYGVISYDGKTTVLDKITVNGIIRQDFIPKNTYSEIGNQYDRQVKAIGNFAHTALQSLSITIVGVGGTGSPLAVQLARMGIKKLRLIDDDKIDLSNLPRVYGSTPDTIGKSKVDVLKKHIQQFSTCDIINLKNNIVQDDVLEELLDSDVIFVCTDNHSSRALLNDIAIQYLIPLIDVGCRITLTDGKINQAIAKIQLVTSETACLWCNGTLNGTNIMQETLSDDEKEKLKQEGYYQPIENQPSIISLTTLASSMAINKLLSHIGIFGNDFDTRTQLELKDNFLLNDTPKLKNNCVCNKRRQLASKRKIFRFDDN